MGCGNSKVKKHTDIEPPPQVQDPISYDEWLYLIKQQRNDYSSKKEHEYDFKTDAKCDDYSLFIKYLTLTQTETGHSVISIVSRIVRHYLGDVRGVTIFNDKSFAFKGVRISLATHPITAELYISDEYNIYKLNDQNKLDKIIEIHKPNNKNNRITDLTFNGDHLLCILDNRLLNYERGGDVFYIDLINKTVNTSVCYDQLADADIKYNFNHCYYSDVGSFITSLIFYNVAVHHGYAKHVTVQDSSGLYCLDSYNENLWFVMNTDPDPSKTQAEGIRPLLVRIPSERMEKIRMLGTSLHEKELCNQIKYELDHSNECKVEAVDLYEILKLSNKHYVIAFDVDRLHGGVYIITSDLVFYRIEKQEYQKSQSVRINKTVSNEYLMQRDHQNVFVYDNKWSVTHQASLKDVLPDGMPLGICTIIYDSVIGRVIIGDNYKLQALYI